MKIKMCWAWCAHTSFGGAIALAMQRAFAVPLIGGVSRLTARDPYEPISNRFSLTIQTR